MATEPKAEIRVLSIDAWRYDGGWTWNQWYEIGHVPREALDMSTRKLLRFLRAEGLLGAGSVGRVRVEDDQYNLTVCAIGTGEPLIALEYGADL